MGIIFFSFFVVPKEKNYAYNKLQSHVLSHAHQSLPAASSASDINNETCFRWSSSSSTQFYFSFLLSFELKLYIYIEVSECINTSPVPMAEWHIAIEWYQKKPHTLLLIHQIKITAQTLVDLKKYIYIHSLSSSRKKKPVALEHFFYVVQHVTKQRDCL